MSTFHDAVAAGMPPGGDICLYGIIGDEWDGCDLKSVAQALADLGDPAEIRVRIHSVGGSVFDGLAIYNLLKNHKAKIITEVMGVACSMASIIALAGDEVIIPEAAHYMIHNPSSWAMGGSDDLRKEASVLDGLKASMVAIYAAKSGKPADEIAALMDAETWMNGSEALAAGFATSTGPALSAVALAGVSDYMGHFQNPPADFARAVAMAGKPTPTKQASPPKRPPQAKASKMDDDENTQVPASTSAPNSGPNSGAGAGSGAGVSPAALAQARALVAEIGAACAKAKLSPEKTAEIVASASTMDAARALIIDAWAAQDSPPQRSGVSVGTSFDDPDAVRGAMARALAAKMSGHVKLAKDDQANKYRGYGLLAMAEDLALAKGERLKGRSRDDLARVAMSTTSDFPRVLGDAAHQALEAEYMAEQPVYRLIAAQRDFVDFRPHNFVRIGDFPGLMELKEGEELKAGSISEGAESAALKTYARTLRLSRQMLVNDNLGAFAQLPASIGRATARLENGLVLGLLLNNTAKLADGKPLFDATHKNRAAMTTALDVAGLSTGRAAMRSQTGLDGEALDIAPKVLLVGPELETEAEKLTTSITAVATGEVNPFSGRLQVGVTAKISGTAWYLLGDPAASPALIYGYLNGAAGPQIEAREGWDYDGAEYRVLHDFGAAVIDHRPVWRNS